MNPAKAAMCDCGWSFTENKFGTPRGSKPSGADDHKRARISRANSQLAIGALLVVVGGVITAVTYGSASTSGGTYIIAYGPIVVGVIKIARGIMALGAEP